MQRFIASIIVALFTLVGINSAQAGVMFNGPDLKFGYNTGDISLNSSYTSAYLRTKTGVIDYVSVDYEADYIYNEKTQTGSYSPNQGRINFNFYGHQQALTSTRPEIDNRLTITKNKVYVIGWWGTFQLTGPDAYARGMTYVQAVPEPACTTLLFGAAAGLLLSRRRRA